MRRLVQTVMDETAGAVAGLSAQTQNGASVHLELLLLPLRYRGRTHARILGALSPALSPEWLGLDTLESMRMISLRMIWPDVRTQRPTEAAAQDKRPKLMLLPGGRV